MKWITAYLNEVGRHLDPATSEGVLEELRVSLEEAARDIASGNDPSETQQKQAINAFGHPMKVASEFNGPRYLIGPLWFGTHLSTLKIVTAIVVSISIGLLLTVYVTDGQTTSVLRSLTGVLDTALTAAVVVTIVFIVLGASAEQIDPYVDWTADKLSLRGAQPLWRVSVGDQLFNLASEVIFLLWWNGAIVFTNVFPTLEGDIPIALGPVWQALYWPLNVLVAGYLLLHVSIVVRCVWSRVTLWAEIALGLVLLVACAWVLLHPPLVVLAGDASAAGSLPHRLAIAFVIVIAGLTLWDLGSAARKLFGRDGNAGMGTITSP
ncbi:MAG: hypothetical protein AAF610_01520 [Pseudomonadota bacterium]